MGENPAPVAPPADNGGPMAWLSGYKTYILAICVVIVAAAHHFGWLDDKLFTTLIAVLVGGGMFTLRSAVKAEVKKEVKKAAKQ